MARFKPKTKQSQPRQATITAELAALFNQSLACHRQGDIHTAEQGYRTFLKFHPDHADALQLLGVLAHQTGRLDAAADLIDKAIRRQPDIPQYHFNLAVVLQELGRKDEAARHYRNSVQLKPDYAEAWDNLGVVLHDLGRFETALEAHQCALSHNPDSLLAHTNIGTLLNRLNRHREALQHFNRAVTINPAHPEARMKRAVSLFYQENFVDAWKEYSWRRHTKAFQEINPEPTIPLPTWNGRPEVEKNLLIYPEQGIGDEVMFASCLRDAEKLFDKIVLACDPRLVNLWRRSFPRCRIISADQLNSREDLECLVRQADMKVALGELPRFLRPNLKSFGAGDAFICPDDETVKTWREKLAGLPGELNIGVSWRGGRDERTRKARSIPLKYWKPLFDLPGVNLINLQYGDCGKDLSSLGRLFQNQLVDFPGHDPVSDLEGFCGLIAALDMVVSVDNSTIHFAGALGVPTVGLLPCPPDWRWFGKKSTTPWYRSLELLHQASAEEEVWEDVLVEAAQRVAAIKPVHQSGPVSTLDPPRSRALPGQSAATNAPRANRALLLNDTSHWYHWGCSCTSLAIHRQLRDHGWLIESVSAGETAQLQGLPANPAEFDESEVLARFRRANPDLVGKKPRPKDGALKAPPEGALPAALKEGSRSVVPTSIRVKI